MNHRSQRFSTEIQLISAGLCAVLSLVGGCGQGSDSSGSGNSIIDGQTPVYVSGTNSAYLQDLTSYQPAQNLTWGTTAGDSGGSPKKGPASPEAGKSVEARLTELTTLLMDQEINRALKLFNPEHVRPLLNDSEPALEKIFNTFEQIAVLKAELADKLKDEEAANKLIRQLKLGAASKPKVELLSSEAGAITPNVTKILFGPVKTGAALGIALVEGDWLFQLESPLEAGDMAAIITHHEGLQAALAAAIDLVSSSDTLSAPEALKQIETILAGETPTGGPKAAPSDPTEKPDNAEPKKDPEKEP